MTPTEKYKILNYVMSKLVDANLSDDNTYRHDSLKLVCIKDKEYVGFTDDAVFILHTNDSLFNSSLLYEIYMNDIKDKEKDIDVFIRVEMDTTVIKQMYSSIRNQVELTPKVEEHIEAMRERSKDLFKLIVE